MDDYDASFSNNDMEEMLDDMNTNYTPDFLDSFDYWEDKENNDYGYWGIHGYEDNL